MDTWFCTYYSLFAFPFLCFNLPLSSPEFFSLFRLCVLGFYSLAFVPLSLAWFFFWFFIQPPSFSVTEAFYGFCLSLCRAGGFLLAFAQTPSWFYFLCLCWVSSCLCWVFPPLVCLRPLCFLFRFFFCRDEDNCSSLFSHSLCEFVPFLLCISALT